MKATIEIKELEVKIAIQDYLAKQGVDVDYLKIDLVATMEYEDRPGAHGAPKFSHARTECLTSDINIKCLPKLMQCGPMLCAREKEHPGPHMSRDEWNALSQPMMVTE